MRTKEPNDKTCGAHDEECNTWCERCQMWECDQCASTCQHESDKMVTSYINQRLNQIKTLP